jgi:PadR family transcriptional regulator, regulatory protein PadR
VVERRQTQALKQVAVALMEDPWGRHWGYQLGKAAGLRSGVMYPLLSRLLDDGLLTDGWEDPAEISGRPPRRYYELTDAGRQELGATAHAARAEAGAAQARRGVGWGFAG